MGRLSGKVALVTGASKGIGAGVARAFAAEGAAVVVNYRSSRSSAEAVVRSIEELGGRAAAVEGDVALSADAEALVEATLARFGRLDVLVNNAGVYEYAPVEAIDEAAFRRTFDLNVLGLLLVTGAAVKHMEEGASVINISSINATQAPAYSSLYSGSKAAVDAITQVLASELGPRRIRVNAIRPGLVETEGLHAIGFIGSRLEEAAIATAPFARIGQPEDIAAVAVFLASDEAGWVNGERLNAAGGVR